MAQRKNSGQPAGPSGMNPAPSATKRGPGRKAQHGKPGTRLTKARPLRAYVALMAAWASKRVTNWKGEIDKHGAFTLTGREYFPDGSQRRRMWLAGISSQRGY